MPRSIQAEERRLLEIVKEERTIYQKKGRREIIGRSENLEKTGRGDMCRKHSQTEPERKGQADCGKTLSDSRRLRSRLLESKGWEELFGGGGAGTLKAYVPGGEAKGC